MAIEDLKNLRDKIKEIDEELIKLMAKRLGYARKVGAYKLEKNLPIKDFKVEKEIIEKSRKRAEKYGVYKDLAADHAKLMIRYAVMAQEQYHVESKKKYSESKKTIGIVGGYGKMGQWFAQFFGSFGHRVLICDHLDLKMEKSTGQYVSNDFFDLTTMADILILAVPISETAKLLTKISKKPVGSIVFDIASLKTPLLKKIEACLASGTRVASIHPMFGPTAELLSGKNIIVCETGDQDLADEVHRLFKDTTANIVRMPIEKHDEYMSYVLGLSHITNLAFAKMLADSGYSFSELKGVASSTFDAQLAVTAPVVSENQYLYYEIQAENKHTKKITQKMINQLSAYLKTIEDNDLPTFKKFMEKSRRYMAGE